MTEQSTTRKVTLWACVIACSAAACYFLIQSLAGPLSQMPDTPESAQDFACQSCGHTFSLTPRKRAEIMANQGRISQDEQTSIRQLKMPCPSCQAVAAVAAAQCSKCGAPYARRTSEGLLRSACPKCLSAAQAAEEKPPLSARKNGGR